MNNIYQNNLTIPRGTYKATGGPNNKYRDGKTGKFVSPTSAGTVFTSFTVSVYNNGLRIYTLN